MKRRILITGGAGFIGHHVAEHFLKNTQDEVVLLDKLSYASPGWNRVRDITISGEMIASDRLSLVSGDFTKPIEPGLSRELGGVTHVIHMGANSHVDSSIKNPVGAIEDNVIGTQYLIDYARTLKDLQLFLYFSTDEVFGPAPAGVNFKEGDRFNSGNVYAATKGASELLCIAAANTWKMPIVITNTMNVFGERQHPEKLIPKAIRMIRAGETMQIHGDSEGNSGSRFWIHARNVADALLYIVDRTEVEHETLSISDPSRGRFNIVGEREITTLDLVQHIADCMGMPLKHEVVDAAAERPGHDFRYALDGGKLAVAGWTHPMSLTDSLAKSLAWMTSDEHKHWLEI